MKIPLSTAQDWACRVLVSVGLPVADAEIVAANLLFAESRGIGGHGLLRLPTYVERIRAGGINRAASLRISTDFGALVIVDADCGPGAAIGVRATDLAIERGQAHGIGCVIARDANHFGVAAFFASRIADAGLVGLAACNTESVMCAPGGGKPILGTNPLAIALPLPYNQRPQLDMATTTVSQGKLLQAAQQSEPIPLGWAVDESGKPTTSPIAGLDGALLPAGGPKGFGLAFAIDALLALGGAKMSPDASPLNGDPAAPQLVGQLFIAIRADGAASLDEYCGKIAELVDAIHASGLGDVAPPLAPGEPELSHERLAAGQVELPDGLVEVLTSLAAETKVPMPRPLGASVVG